LDRKEIVFTINFHFDFDIAIKWIHVLFFFDFAAVVKEIGKTFEIRCHESGMST
jgi:hypothetical protein